MTAETNEPTVNYYVRGREETDGERRTIPASEIQALADSALREALELQATMAADPTIKESLVVNAWPNETFHTSFTVSHIPLGVKFTKDGIVELSSE
jgi:hypothetical protein